MIRPLCSLAILIAAAASVFAGETYVGAAGALTLASGGAGMRRTGGGLVRAGTYLTDSLAVETEAGVAENLAALGAAGVFHLTGIEYYDYLFGFSRLDPFVKAGAKGWIGDDGEVGPFAGIGANYHLTDNWSLRVDADAVLGLDGGADMVYAISLGIQYGF